LSIFSGIDPEKTLFSTFLQMSTQNQYLGANDAKKCSTKKIGKMVVVTMFRASMIFVSEKLFSFLQNTKNLRVIILLRRISVVTII
jgi:hypothetical protein